MVLWDPEANAVIETATAVLLARFPYIPGYLTFREGPAVLAAFAGLSRRPTAVLFDGQGIAHPRRFGLAAHLGLWLGLPSVGVAKSHFCGEAEEPGPAPGDATPLHDGDELLGAVLRTRLRCRPLYVSPGHLLSVPAALRLTLAACRGHRLPEPTRQAHLAVNRLRREAGAVDPAPAPDGGAGKPPPLW